MKTNRFLYLIVIAALLVTINACKMNSTEKVFETEKVEISWELKSNFIGERSYSKAIFKVTNLASQPLGDTGWSLFFNQNTRRIIRQDSLPAEVKHVNGYLYKLIPNKGFMLKPGQSTEIEYLMNDCMIKEVDAPQGLYFVFDDNNGEEYVYAVDNFSILPFIKPEQINRNPDDQEPIPTPEFCFNENLKINELPDDELLKIIPRPVDIVLHNDKIALSASTKIVYTSSLIKEATLLSTYLTKIIGSSIEIVEGDNSNGSGNILLRTGDVKVGKVSSEAYKLNVSFDGIVIEGSDPAGVFYGIQSLMALMPVNVHRESSSVIELGTLDIKDAPRFPYRGYHLDVARNFQNKESVLKLIDVLAYYKINTLHFHLTDDEGWRIAINELPELTEVGSMRGHSTNEKTYLIPAFGSGPFPDAENNYGTGFYTQNDFVEILKYADERHIAVIPEINFPGHSRAAIVSMEYRYNRFMAEGKEKEALEYRLADPEDKSEYFSAQYFNNNVVCVAYESTFHFYETVVKNLKGMYNLAGVPFNTIHTGGDEVPEGAWAKSPACLTLLDELPEIKDPKNLQSYFLKRLLGVLEKYDLTVAGWEEVALIKNDNGNYEPNPEFANKKVVPYVWNNLWGSQDLGYRLANAGYDVVLCNVTNFYFDLAYNKDPKEPGLYWGGFVNTRNAFEFIPFDVFKSTLIDDMGARINTEIYKDMEHLQDEARDNIIGIQSQLWSETVKGQDMMEYYTLPKLIGFAESAWSQEKAWETIENIEERIKEIDTDWNIFANTIGKKELKRLNYIFGGYNYRIPAPGAIILDGKLHANSSYPGFVIRYTIDGSDPNATSEEYIGPVDVNSSVKLKSFNELGRSSRTVQLK